MIEEKGGSTQILERLMSSYGVNTQKDLAAALGIPANNISGWTQRDSVPGNAIIKCALDTGAELRWLVSGELAKASFIRGADALIGKVLYDEITSSGGKPVLRRIMDAYGFTLQKQLCERLGISSGTVSTWVRRNYFPGDVVVTCALETGASLQWLATGKENQKKSLDNEHNVTSIPKKNLNDGVLIDTGFWSVDLSIISNVIKTPILISSNTDLWIIDGSVNELSNGLWLLGVDDKYDIYKVALLPGKKISVNSGGDSFVCMDNEVYGYGKVAVTIGKNF
ncbi:MULTISPECIES: phage repressor protein CI [Pantoea]|uniref:Repressor n=2 Tax=Pantoea TaxID=53335 RepID=A0A0U3JT94_9GAMM|nr:MULTISPECIES: phage repressor protein CI [Pantoea]ALV92030.1 repressor [Pantoea vagans]KHJ66011.1 repressor [Pantoea rodasii]